MYANSCTARTYVQTETVMLNKIRDRTPQELPPAMDFGGCLSRVSCGPLSAIFKVPLKCQSIAPPNGLIQSQKYRETGKVKRKKMHYFMI